VIVTTAVCVSKCGVTDTMIETGVIIARGAWSLSSIVAIITTTKNAEDDLCVPKTLSGFIE